MSADWVALAWLCAVGGSPTTSLPERTPKKTTVPPIVALLSNGCKQAFPLLTVDLQRARHSTLNVQLCVDLCLLIQRFFMFQY
jgi:hypothetical protein